MLYPFIKKSSDSCQADLKFIEWWLIMSHLNDLLQINQVFSCKQFGDFFLDRWETLIPLTRHPDSCQAFFVFYWLIMACLNKVVQVAARSFSCEQLGDSFLDRWEMLCIPSFKKVLTVVKLIWSSLSDDWSCFSWIWLYELQPDLLAASSSVTFSRQMRGVSFFIFPQNSCHDSYQAILNFIDWWLSVSHLNEILQVTVRSSRCKQFGDFLSTDWGVYVLHPSQNILTAGKHFWR